MRSPIKILIRNEENEPSANGDEEWIGKLDTILTSCRDRRGARVKSEIRKHVITLNLKKRLGHHIEYLRAHELYEL